MSLTQTWTRYGIDMQLEAFKMWFYGIAASLVLGAYELFALYYPPPGAKKIPASGKESLQEEVGNAGRRGQAGEGVRTSSSQSKSHDEKDDGNGWEAIEDPGRDTPEGEESKAKTNSATAPTTEPSQVPDRPLKESSKNKTSAPSTFAAKRNKIITQLAIDTCDILIPGAAVGWIPLDAVYTGIAGGVSAGISLRGMCLKVMERGRYS